MAKATSTHYGTKTPSVLLCKTACREVYYRGRRGMGWDGVMGYEYGLRGYAAWYVRYRRCIARIKEKKTKKEKRKKTHGCINKPWVLVKCPLTSEGHGGSCDAGGDWGLGRCVERAGSRGQTC